MNQALYAHMNNKRKKKKNKSHKPATSWALVAHTCNPNEVQIRRISVSGQPRQNVCKSLSQWDGQPIDETDTRAQLEMGNEDRLMRPATDRCLLKREPIILLQNFVYLLDQEYLFN
jgi:hypothetical protein